MPWVSLKDIETKAQYIENLEKLKFSMEPAIGTINALIDLAESMPDDYVYVKWYTPNENR